MVEDLCWATLRQSRTALSVAQQADRYALEIFGIPRSGDKAVSNVALSVVGPGCCWVVGSDFQSCRPCFAALDRIWFEVPVFRG